MLIECPYCKKKVVASAGAAGPEERCPRCGKSIGVPAQSTTTAATENPAHPMLAAIPLERVSRPKRTPWSVPSEWSNARKGTVGFAIIGAILAVLSIARRIYEARHGDRATAVKFDADLAASNNAALESMDAFLSLAVRWSRGERVDPVELNRTRRKAFRDAEACLAAAQGSTSPKLMGAAEYRNQARSTALELQAIAANDAAEIEKLIGDGSPGGESARSAVASSLKSAAARVMKSADALGRAQNDFRASSSQR